MSPGTVLTVKRLESSLMNSIFPKVLLKNENALCFASKLLLAWVAWVHTIALPKVSNLGEKPCAVIGQ